MKLPGKERLQVQSLGREESSLAMQRGLAKSRQYGVIGDTVDQVNQAVQREIVEPAYQQEAVAQYAKAEEFQANALAEAESLINNPNGVVTPDQIPTWVDYREFDDDGAGGITRREFIPTHEVAGEWYKGEMKRTHSAAMSAMTNQQAIRKMKADYGSKYIDNYATVLLNAQKQKRDAQRADVESIIETNTRREDLTAVNRTVLMAMEAGILTPGEGEDKLFEAPGRVAVHSYMRQINTARDISELDNLESYIYQDARMDFQQMDQVVSDLQGRRKAMEAGYTTGKDENSARVLNEELIKMDENRDGIDPERLRNLRYQMNAADHKTLIVANKALNEKKVDESDPAAMSTLQASINDLMSPSDEPIQLRRGALVERINNALDSELINSADAWTLLQRINTAEEMAFKTPDMDMAIDHIYKIYTQGSKSAIGLNSSPVDILIATEAERDLYEAARATGPGFDAIQWLQDNRERYDTRRVVKNQYTADRNRAKEQYLVRDKEGQLLTKESKDKVGAALERGAITDKMAREILQPITVLEGQLITGDN